MGAPRRAGQRRRPTFVRTLVDEALLAEPALERRLLDDTLMGRLATPEEVAAAILFLAGDAAAMVTALILPVARRLACASHATAACEGTHSLRGSSMP